jgi:hypothetical protein
MSYREENGQVILSMSREDYNRVLNAFASLCGRWLAAGKNIEPILDTLNRLNEGNPAWSPYEAMAAADVRAAINKKKARWPATT